MKKRKKSKRKKDKSQKNLDHFFISKINRKRNRNVLDEKDIEPFVKKRKVLNENDDEKKEEEVKGVTDDSKYYDESTCCVCYKKQCQDFCGYKNCRQAICNKCDGWPSDKEQLRCINHKNYN